MDSLKKISCHVRQRTIEAIQKNCREVDTGFEINVLEGVANTVWPGVVACLLGLPLRPVSTSKAAFDERTLQSKLEHLFRYIFSFTEFSTRQEPALKRDAMQANGELTQVITEACEAVKGSSTVRPVLQQDCKDKQDTDLIEHGDELLRRLLDSGKSVEEVVSLVILLAVQIAIAGRSSVWSAPSPWIPKQVA